MRVISVFLGLASLLVFFAGCTENLNQAMFSAAENQVGKTKYVEYINEDLHIYIGFDYPVLAGKLEKEANVESFPYQIDYYNGLLKDLTVFVHEQESWGNDAGESLVFETENFVFVVEKAFEDQETMDVILESFTVEEI